MKLFITFITAVMVMGAGSFVYADDEFGKRFGGDTPTALQDKTPPVEDALQDIEPAAGEEGVDENAKHEAPDSDAVRPDEELEEKMGTEVQTTTQNLGDGQVKQHDSVGEGNIRAFYRNEKDERVMDDTDAAGVEVKILDFE